ncbi:MAG: acyl-CoA dehydrogenase family protein [Alphaproteobacteria bacterium]
MVNGGKVWTTKAQDADWIFCLVRTSNEGRKQEGITFLMIDMRTPGVTVNPIILMDLADDGLQEVNEVVFEDVRVPVANRVGEENKGWTYAKYLLEFERGGSYAASLQAGLNRLRTFSRQEAAGGAPLFDDADFVGKMARLETEITALELAELRTLSALSSGERPGAQSSLIKLRGSDLTQSLTELNLQAVGYYGMPYDREWFPFGGNMDSIGPAHSPTALFRYCNRRKVTIYGGTNEVQRTIIAKHILGL